MDTLIRQSNKPGIENNGRMDKSMSDCQTRQVKDLMRPNIPERAECTRGRNDGPNRAENHVATLNRCKDVPDAEEDDMSHEDAAQKSRDDDSPLLSQKSLKVSMLPETLRCQC